MFYEKDRALSRFIGSFCPNLCYSDLVIADKLKVIITTAVMLNF